MKMNVENLPLDANGHKLRESTVEVTTFNGVGPLVSGFVYNCAVCDIAP
ncbi:hypothetical protein AB0D66_33430 [Streptomyces sp. NPDC048270]